MDYTAILSSIESSISGVGGILIVAIAGVLIMIGAHYKRMHSNRTRTDRSFKSYKNTVIAPYSEEDDEDSAHAMSSHFSSTAS